MRTIELIRLDASTSPEAVVPPGVAAKIERDIPPSDLRPRVALLTLGCKVNSSETEALAENFQQAGYVLVEPDGVDIPDVFVVNTCTVTHVADRKSRQVLRRAKRANPQTLVVATGCYVYTSFEQVSALPEVDLVIGKSDQSRTVELVSNRLNYELTYRPETLPWLLAGGTKTEQVVEGRYRTRAMVKIQDGCNAGCAFCIVPTARGGPRSVGIPAVLEGVRHKLAEGYQEVVLTGVHLGKYRTGDNSERPLRLRALLEAILTELPVPRLRITSLEPQDYDPTLLELWQQDRRLARHFHLALQSGSAATITRMRRGYSLERYQQIVEQIRRDLPDASITTDIIVGFPGETEAEFSETLAFAEQMAFSKIHVFPYSMRAGTPAATMPNQVSDEVKKERGERLRYLSDELSRRWRQQFVGQVRPVLWEHPYIKDGNWNGLTDNYLRVYAKAEGDLYNQIIPAHLVGLSVSGDSDGMQGELISEGEG